MHDNSEKTFITAKRLKEERELKQLSHQRLSDKIREATGGALTISKDCLINYEVSDPNHTKAYKVDGMSIKNLRFLAQFYGVSADYLLGLTDVKTPNTNIRQIAEATTLEAETVESLLKLKRPVKMLIDAFFTRMVSENGEPFTAMDMFFKKCLDAYIANKNASTEDSPSKSKTTTLALAIQYLKHGYTPTNVEIRDWHEQKAVEGVSALTAIVVRDFVRTKYDAFEALTDSVLNPPPFDKIPDESQEHFLTNQGGVYGDD